MSNAFASPDAEWDGDSVAIAPALRRLAPPLDSIRPGNSFSLSRLPWFPANLYPTALDLKHPPIGRAVSLAGGSSGGAGFGGGGGGGGGDDPLYPLATCLGISKR
jgi:hypothetical protein